MFVPFQTLALLEEEDDINQITDYFSYEHFYVIYCKFWELDTDHDLYISQKDLARYSDQGMLPENMVWRGHCWKQNIPAEEQNLALIWLI